MIKRFSKWSTQEPSRKETTGLVKARCRGQKGKQTDVEVSVTPICWMFVQCKLSSTFKY